ncbi:hypothetical protein QBC36DRAFT_355768 [Triangularia setosa]|uniref:Uncharacterized protein n=1 Tax=Triangularia setosa TaxID=2587417 RepID=A0AAN7ABI3_9PEZI|nr:hypothetical protein QBC36DRAFT_355768 [Podospora setosa]
MAQQGMMMQRTEGGYGVSRVLVFCSLSLVASGIAELVERRSRYLLMDEIDQIMTIIASTEAVTGCRANNNGRVSFACQDSREAQTIAWSPQQAATQCASRSLPPRPILPTPHPTACVVVLAATQLVRGDGPRHLQPEPHSLHSQLTHAAPHLQLTPHILLRNALDQRGTPIDDLLDVYMQLTPAQGANRSQFCKTTQRPPHLGERES